MKPRRWTQIKVQIPAYRQDLLAGQLAALGFSGFLQEDTALSGFIETGQWNRDLRDRLEYCLRQFREQFPNLRLRYSTNTVRLQNWNRAWERSITIVEAAPGIIVKPSWKRLRAGDKGKIVLHIDPKMSFGTGHHESTRLCLKLLREYVRPGMTVLDFGSGTGILAIASVKLGARRAVAVDNDDWTIPNIKENLRRNRVQSNVRIVLGEARNVPALKYDLIVANVDLPTIGRVHSTLARKLRTGGLMIVSGLLTTDLVPLHKLLKHSGISPLDIIEENEWSAMALVRT